MQFTHYQITGGKVFAVNPTKKLDINNPRRVFSITAIKENNKHYAAFETWLSTQPPITADPSIKDGVYKVDDLEIVWQILSDSGKDAEYITVTELTAKMSPGFIPRLYLRLKQPVKPTSEEMTEFNVDAVYNSIFEQPVKQEEKEVKHMSIVDQVRLLVEHCSDPVSDFFVSVAFPFDGKNPHVEVQEFTNSETRLSCLKLEDKTVAFVIEKRTELNHVEFTFIK
jgi:hypothetical protein